MSTLWKNLRTVNCLKLMVKCSVGMLVPVKVRHTRNTCTIIIIESSRLQSRDIYTLHNTASVTLLPPQSSNRPRFDPTLCNYCLSKSCAEA